MKTVRNALAIFLAADALLSVYAGDPLGRPSQFTVGQSENDDRTCIILTSLGRYGFAPPRGWSVAPDSANHLVRIYAPDKQCVITLEFTDENPGGTSGSGGWEAKLQDGRPNSEPGEISVFEWQGAVARVMDLAWDHADSIRMEGRFLRLPIGRRAIEVSLVCPAGLFENALPRLMQLVGSIRAGTVDEPLPVRRLSRE